MELPQRMLLRVQGTTKQYKHNEGRRKMKPKYKKRFSVRGRLWYSEANFDWKFIPIDKKGFNLMSASKIKHISFRKIFEQFKNDDIIRITFEVVKQ